MIVTNPQLPNWLLQRAALSADRLAISAGTGQITFRQLADRAITAAGQLAALGVRRGDRVALLGNNTLEVVVLLHAVSLIGAVLVPLNTRLSPAEIGWQVDNVAAAALLYDTPNAGVARESLAYRPDVSLIQFPLQIAPVQPALLNRYDLDAIHSIIHTSGTTGHARGALLTFGNHWWSAIASALNLGHSAEDRWLAVLPLFHVGGLSIALKSVIYGIPMVLQDGFDPAAANRAIDEDGVTVVSAVAVMLSRMLEQRGSRPYPPWLRCVLLGGGPAPRVLLEACATRGIPVAQTYGLTEASSQVATLSPEDALRKLGSAGKPLMVTDLRIMRAGVPLGHGERNVGEIAVRGPTVSPGYHNQPAATAATFREGWLHTGDLGYVDEDGYLYVVDRRDDLIISGGENIYPAEVEAALLAHPDVLEAGVTGLPDAQWGSVPAAALVIRDGATLSLEAVRDFLSTRLARYKLPTRLRVVTALPRTASGKIIRRRLAELWQDQV
jgi:O-succinylbenzoic acid--CoA ligase